MLTAMIGVVFSYYSAIMIGLAVGIAITLMIITKTIHPAAGANPILIIESGQSWDFLIMPVLAGTVFIVLSGFVARWFIQYLMDNKYKKPLNAVSFIQSTQLIKQHREVGGNRDLCEQAQLSKALLLCSLLRFV